MTEPWIENPDPGRRSARAPPSPPSTLDGVWPSFDWKKAVAACVVGMCLFSLLGESSSLSRNVLDPLASYFEGEWAVASSLSRQNPEVTRRTFVVTTTFYPDISDIRFDIAMEMCRLAKVYEMHLIIVYDSLDHEEVKDQFEGAGTLEYVHVYRQNKGRWPGKGGALKQPIRHVADLIQKKNGKLGNRLNDTVICFTEPKKVDLMNRMSLVSKPKLDGDADVVVNRGTTRCSGRRTPSSNITANRLAICTLTCLRNRPRGSKETWWSISTGSSDRSHSRRASPATGWITLVRPDIATYLTTLKFTRVS